MFYNKTTCFTTKQHVLQQKLSFDYVSNRRFTTKQHVLQQKLSFDYVSNRRLLSFSFKTKMAEEQKYL